MDASRGSSNIFSMPHIPALLFAPPPPPPLPSSSLSLSTYSSSSSSLRGHGHAPSITNFPILLLTVLGILAAAVILLAYYVFVIRCCLTWHRDRSRSRSSSFDDVAGLIVSRSGLRPQRTTGTTNTALADAEPRGLADAAIRALPAFSYRKKPTAAATEPSAPASECAVCLGEFEEGDRVRMLPACLHVFHLGCVDAWLQGNASCPLCRASADVAATLCCLSPLQEVEEEVVTIQVVVPVAEEDGQDDALRLSQQRAATVAPAEFEREDHQVGGEKTKSAIDGMTERRKDGEVLPPRTRTSFSTDGDAMTAGGGGEVHLQIHNILHLQRDSHSRTHDHDTDSVVLV